MEIYELVIVDSSVNVFSTIVCYCLLPVKGATTPVIYCNGA